MTAAIDTTLPTDAAKVLRRRAYEAIEDYYDEVRKRYKPSLTGGRHTDKSIADELQCAEQLVAKVREEFFGPNTVTSEPDALKGVKTDLAYLQKEAGEIENLAKGLRQQAKTWQAKADEMARRVDELCADHGWGA